MSKFKFDEKAHVYTLDGKPMTGVTTILNVIAKPMLIQWAANMAVDFIEKNGTAPEMLKEARVAHRKKKEAAGEAGTDIHAQIELRIKLAIEKTDGFIQSTEATSPQVLKFISWAKENNVKFLESEKMLYSEKYFYAGTCDFTCEIGGKRYVGDLKTSSGIYYEHFLQCAGYRIMLEEMGEPEYHGAIIVRCGKDGAFETKENFDYETAIDAFLATLTLFRAKQQYDI